jgi:hypothetical protein
MLGVAPDESSTECVANIAKCKQKSIFTSIQNTYSL